MAYHMLQQQFDNYLRTNMCGVLLNGDLIPPIPRPSNRIQRGMPMQY